MLVIPVPELNPWVRDRTGYYDRSFLSDDPEFVNAHITLLGPWIREPSAADLAAVAAIADSTPAFDYRLTELAAFPGGVIYLDPDPAHPFARLTAELATAFPAYQPYGGAFRSVVPHLTLDQIGTDVSLASVRASLGDSVPVASSAERIDLQWWENDRCRRLHTWRLAH